MDHAPDGLQAIVFDFDGTLAHLTIDFGLMRSKVLAIVRAHGLLDEDLEGMHVLEMVEEACRRAPAADGLGRHCAEAIEAVELAAASEACLVDGVAKALHALREAGLSVGVITRNCRRAVLAVDPGILDRVDALVAREDAHRVKPDPSHVHQCLGIMGAAEARAAVVGDHPMDMATAGHAGALGVGVLTGNSSAADLEDAGADVVVADVPAAVAWILGRGRVGG